MISNIVSEVVTIIGAYLASLSLLFLVEIILAGTIFKDLCQKGGGWGCAVFIPLNIIIAFFVTIPVYFIFRRVMKSSSNQKFLFSVISIIALLISFVIFKNFGPEF